MSKWLTSGTVSCEPDQAPLGQESLSKCTYGERALQRLLPLVQRRTSQSRVVARFLLGLYSNTRFPFRLVDLKVLDRAIFKDCLTVLAMSNECAQHLYAYFANGSQRWEQLASDWRFNGAV
jgi:hypothetical protein